MKKTFSTLVAVLLANVIATQVAHATVYEAPFVAVGGGQVLGSEGKVNEDGSYKVELQIPAFPNTTFEVCAVYDGGYLFLTDVTTTEDGELKAVGLEGAIPAGNYQQFSFVVGADSANDCLGTPMWLSGFTLPVP